MLYCILPPMIIKGEEITLVCFSSHCLLPAVDIYSCLLTPSAQVLQQSSFFPAGMISGNMGDKR